MRTQRFEETTEANRAAAASAAVAQRAWERTRLADADAATASQLAALARLLSTAAPGTRAAALAQAAELIARASAADRVGLYLASEPLAPAPGADAEFLLAASWARPGLGFHGDPMLRVPGPDPGPTAGSAAGPRDAARALDLAALERALAARVLPCAGASGVVALVTLAGPGRASAGIEETVAALVAGFLERDRLERELVAVRARVARDERLAQLGRVACSAAHDFNNVLTAILGYADLLELERVDAAASDGRVASEDVPGRVELEEIRMAAARGASLVEEVLGFGRRRAAVAPSEVELADTIGCLEGLLRRVAGDRIALDLALAADLPPVRIDVERLERVLMNLVANARHAIEARPDPARAGGRIEIALERVDDPSSPTAQSLRLVVRDDGCGMSRALARRALEPFFTTRAARGGTGLGLADAAAFARRAGGRLEIDSAEGRGTAVALLLPTAGSPDRGSSDRVARVAPVDSPAV